MDHPLTLDDLPPEFAAMLCRYLEPIVEETGDQQAIMLGDFYNALSAREKGKSAEKELRDAAAADAMVREHLAKFRAALRR